MVERCGRCNRKLNDDESIARGYGPLCWEKVKAGDLVIKKRLKSTVLDLVTATESRFKILDKIIELKPPYDKCSCGEKFTKCTLKSYDHSDGILVNGYKYPQWFYLHCEECGHDTALNSIFKSKASC